MHVFNSLKYIFLLLFIEITGSFSYAQTYLKGQSQDGQLKVYLVDDDNHGFGRLALIFYIENKVDTLILEEYELNDMAFIKIDTCMVKSLQLSSTNQRYAHLTWIEKEGKLESNHCYKTINRVWNLSNKTQLFSAISSSEYKNNIGTTNDSNALNDATSCSYQYDFSIDTSAKITIENIKENLQGDCGAYSADHRAGVYALYGNKYIRVGP